MVCVWLRHKQSLKSCRMYHFSSLIQSCPTFCDYMNHSTPSLLVYHQLPESTQNHVHWVSDTIQPSHPVIPFSSHPQSFSASGSFQMGQLFASSGQRIGVSASVPPMNTQDWSPLEWIGWISFQPKGLSRVFSNTTVQKLQFFWCFLYSPSLTSIYGYWKNHSFD